MIEKMNAELTPEVTQRLQQYFELPNTSTIQQDIFRQLSGEGKLIRYPQKGDNTHFMGLFVQPIHSKNIIQLLIECNQKNYQIIDIVTNASVAQLEQTMPLKFQFTKEENELSAQFWTDFYKLPVNEALQETLSKLDSWNLYLQYLIDESNYPYTIKSVEKIAANQYKIAFYDDIKPQQAASTLYFNNIAISRNITADAAERQIVVETDKNIVSLEGKEVFLYEPEQLRKAKENQRQLKKVIMQEQRKPSLHNPLLNPFYAEDGFFGYSVTVEDKPDALQEVIEAITKEQQTAAVLLCKPELEAQFVQQFIHLKPYSTSGFEKKVIDFVKKPIIEKSAIKAKQLMNILSAEEEAVQLRAIQKYEAKIEAEKTRIANLENRQAYLSKEEEKNSQKIKNFEEAIVQYEAEQEQLAFRNDQLIKLKTDLELKIKEQNEQLDEFENQKESDTQYYAKLEQRWLLFSKESASYKDNIVSLKTIDKSKSIIADSYEKLDVIQVEKNKGQQLLEEMQQEYKIFKENQQVDQIEILIKKMKKLADYLNISIDLQFASSYSELTSIYMDKFAEIESLEERFKANTAEIKNEFYQQQVDYPAPTESFYNYDRHFAEEKMSTLLQLLEKKPIDLGLNFKVKQKWKEQLTESAAELEKMLISMNREKELLEEKLMTQLQYAEQLVTHFEGDVEVLEGSVQQHYETLAYSANEYEEIINIAKADIKNMEAIIHEMSNATDGRSKDFIQLEDLEKIRSDFKAELLDKYNVLEESSEKIEQLMEYIYNLELEYEEKGQAVIDDKAEMDVQMDVLQHDIVNTRKSIEQLLQMNHVVAQQTAFLQQQITFANENITLLLPNLNPIQEDLAAKKTLRAESRALLSNVGQWHKELNDAAKDIEWQQIIKQDSRLHFIQQVDEELEFDTLLVDDQHYTWLEMLMLAQEQTIRFVTTDVSERAIYKIEEYERYLQQKGLSYFARQQKLQHLKLNPFTRFEIVFEKNKKLQLVQNNIVKIPM